VFHSFTLKFKSGTNVDGTSCKSIQTKDAAVIDVSLFTVGTNEHQTHTG